MNKSTPDLHIDPNALPASLRELARVLGDGNAVRLVGLAGGGRLSVPKRIPIVKEGQDEHPLATALGAEVFAKLVAVYGGETIDIPKGDAYLRELRHDQVRRCREQGLSLDETAQVTGYTRRHVINIMGGEADGTDTLTRDMFEAETERPAKANDPFGAWWGNALGSNAVHNRRKPV